MQVHIYTQSDTQGHVYIYTHKADSRLIHITRKQSHTAMATPMTLMAHSTVTFGHFVVPLCHMYDTTTQTMI